MSLNLFLSNLFLTANNLPWNWVLKVRHKIQESSNVLLSLSRLEEARNAKQKLTRQMREKDDELEKSNGKVDSLRQDIKRADALRKDVIIFFIGHKIKRDFTLHLQSLCTYTVMGCVLVLIFTARAPQRGAQRRSHGTS